MHCRQPDPGCGKAFHISGFAIQNFNFLSQRSKFSIREHSGRCPRAQKIARTVCRQRFMGRKTTRPEREAAIRLAHVKQTCGHRILKVPYTAHNLFQPKIGCGKALHTSGFPFRSSKFPTRTSKKPFHRIAARLQLRARCWQRQRGSAYRSNNLPAPHFNLPTTYFNLK